MSNEISWETVQFQRHRPHLEKVAYRMLGSISEAEDALQEAWLRLGRSQQDTIHNPKSWLTTIVGRVCVDMLRARGARREDYVGAWVPEPIVAVPQPDDPEQQALMADSIGLALLVVLETLTPTERVAYVLHDMFAVPFSEVGRIVDRSPEAARQLASRARRRIRGRAPEPDADLGKQREVIDAFLAAARAGDFGALVAALDPNVVFRASGDRDKPLERTGAADVAHTWATFGPRLAGLCAPALVNGQVGLLIETTQTRLGAVGFSIVSGLIATIDLTLDPDKLEMLSREADALSVDPGRSPEAVSLDHLRGSADSAAHRIITEALRWPGVHRARGHLGSVVLQCKHGELGHLHGDVVADVPLPHGVSVRHIENATASVERWGSPAPGWVAIPLDTEEGIQSALALLRDNYEQASRGSDAGDVADR